MPARKTSAKRQAVISAGLRERIGLRLGGKVLVTLADGRKVVIEPVPDDPIGAACGMLRGGSSMTKALIRERREDDARAKKKFTRHLRHADPSGQKARVGKG